MAGFVSKVKSGDPLVISASTFNTIADAVNGWFNQQRCIARGVPAGTSGDNSILIQNTSGADRSQYDILGFTAAPLKPKDSVPLFAERFLFTGVTPRLATHAVRHAVLLEPIKNNKFGRARIDGIGLARVLMRYEGDTQAMVKDNDPVQFESCAAGGSAQLLWVEPAADRLNPWAWAVTRMGIDPPGSFLARITGFSQIGSNRRWKYSWVEVRLTTADSYQDVPNGRSGTTSDNYALNIIELNNLADGAGTQGNSVKENRTGFPSTMDLQPVGGITDHVQVIVQMWSGTKYGTDPAGSPGYWFAYENAHDGSCSALDF